MANNLKMDLIQTIRTFYTQGWSKRRIARELRIDRQTVRRHLAEISKSPTLSTSGFSTVPDQNHPLSTPGDSGSANQTDPLSTSGQAEVSEAISQVFGRPSKCQPHADLIASKLELGLTAQRIYQDLVNEVGFSGSYQAVKRFVRSLKETEPMLVHRIEVQPGEEAQVDFGSGAPIQMENGRCRRPWIFRVVLSFSRRGYSEAVWHQTTENFIRCLENAFRYFGGVPKTINLDNLKAAVSRADWYDPNLNPKLLAFCQHYGTALMPCLPRKAEHKGKVERNIRYVKCNGLKGHRFTSLQAQNEHLMHWEKTVADVRIHGTVRKQVAALFAQEKPFLLPLPTDLFPAFDEAQRTVHRDAHVEVARAYYRVPPEYIGRTVWVRWDARCVRISNQRGEQIQMHPRQAPGTFTKPLGIGGGHGTLEQNLQYWLKRVSEMGHPCADWAKGVVQQRGPLAIRSLIGMAGLTNKHSFKAINQACAQAISKGQWQLRQVEQLIQVPSVQTHFQFSENHPLIRNLAEYGLFIKAQQT
jgi:transposase